MNPIVALLLHFCISSMSCKSIKYIDLDPKKDIFDEKSSPTETDKQKIFSNQLRFLKVLPMNKEWKNKIDENNIESKTKKKSSIPFAIIVATSDENLDKLKNSELNKNKSDIQVKEDVNDHKSKLHNDNKSGMTLKNIEEQIGEVLLRISDTKSNTGEDDHSEINNEKLISISKNPQIKDEINLENQLEHIVIPDNDAKMRELLTDISETKPENKEKLQNKEETERRHVMHEVQNDPEDATVSNPVSGEKIKKSDPCNGHYINFNEDGLKSYPISYVLNKYVFVN